MTSAEGLRALVGLDGGATSAKACRVRVGADGLCSDGPPVEVVHVRRVGFTPVAREQAQCAAFSAEERACGQAWIEAAARAVSGAAGAGGGVLLGVAMPGLKTADGRGIRWARNGPRIPDLLPRLEGELRSAGISLVAPSAGLFSDGDSCGWGERHAVGGLFAGVRNAWYAGGGTGLAEALQLDGEPLDLVASDPSLPRAWELVWRGELTFEDALSLSGLNARAGGPLERVADTPLGRAAQLEAAEALAELASRRSREVEALGHGPLERAVVGQRLGMLLADGRLPAMRAALSQALEVRGLPAEGWLHLSRLREAPALGAAARALEALEDLRG